MLNMENIKPILKRENVDFLALRDISRGSVTRLRKVISLAFGCNSRNDLAQKVTPNTKE